jgi:hypothetical protein
MLVVKHFTMEVQMRTFDFSVTIASEALDTEVIEDSLREAMADSLPDDTLVLVKAAGVKEYSEQGWKVARNRKFGISIKDAGDGHKAKSTKVEVETETVGA